MKGITAGLGLSIQCQPTCLGHASTCRVFLPLVQSNNTGGDYLTAVALIGDGSGDIFVAGSTFVGGMITAPRWYLSCVHTATLKTLLVGTVELAKSRPSYSKFK